MTQLQSRLPVVDYLGRDFESIVQDLRVFVQTRRGRDINSFFEGDLPKAFIEMIAFIGDMLSFSIDRTGEEAFLVTARLRDTALRHAATFGYPVSTVKSASTSLTPRAFTDIPPELTQSVSADETQTLSLIVTGSPAGTFTLTFEGQTTVAIAYGADIASAIQEELETLSTIGEGNIAVTGPVSGVYTLRFRGEKAFLPFAIITVDGSGLSDVSASTARTVLGVNNSLDVLFLKGTTITGGGLTWEVTEDTLIHGIDVSVDTFEQLFRVPVVEGRTTVETFTSDGSGFQRYQTTSGNVVGSALDVRVGDTTSDAWTQILAIALANSEDKSYAVRYNSVGQATLIFGDGSTGQIPGNEQVIFVTLLVSSGSAGNVGIGAILDTLTGVADVDGVGVQKSVLMTNQDPANGGTDPETLDQIRQRIPAWVRTVDKAITKEDYDTLGGQFDGDTVGAVARCASYLATGTVLFQTIGPPVTPTSPLVLAKGATVVIDNRTYELAQEMRVTEEDPILFFNPNTVYVYAWSLGTTGFEGSNDALLAALRTYLQERSVITTTIFCIAGRQKVIDVNLGTVIYDPAFTSLDVRTRITEALLDFFVSGTIQPGEPLRLSDVYGLVEQTAGVDHFVMTAPVADVTMRKDEIAVLGTLTLELQPKTVPLDTDANRTAFDDELFS